MRWSARSVAVRAVPLALVPFVDHVLDAAGRPDPDWNRFVALLWTVALVAACWAAVDAVLGARRGDRIRVGLLVWLAVAAASAVLNVVVDIAWRATSEGLLPLVSGSTVVQFLLFRAAVVAAPAVVALGLVAALTRVPGRRTGDAPSTGGINPSRS